MKASLIIAIMECEYIRFKSSGNLQQENYPSSLNFSNISIVSDEEFYDTENLKNVELNYMTDPKEILTIDFNNLNDLENLHRDGFKNQIITKCRCNGTIDGILVWFKLHVDHETEIDSSHEKSCWQYAVFPAASRKVFKGDEVVINLEIQSGNVKCSYNTTSQTSLDVEYKMPSEVVTFLNDIEYIEMLVKIAKEKNSKVDTVLDTCPFPIYGLEILRNRPDCKKMYFQTSDKELEILITKVAEKNGISKKRLQFIADFREIDCYIDDIHIQRFDTKGEPKDWGQQSCNDLFRCLLNPSGSMMPRKFHLMGQLVFCHDLPNMVRVRNENIQSSQFPQSSVNLEKVRIVVFASKLIF